MMSEALESELLRTTLCGYRNFTNLFTTDALMDLHPTLPISCDHYPPSTNEQSKIFDANHWTRITSQNWHIPLTACAIYLVMIRVLKAYMRERKPIRLTPIVIVWNFGLSLFSFCGMVLCVPHLLYGPAGLLTTNLHTAVCSHAASYGHGRVGFFVALFIYSKLAELFDTLWLLLRKSPVIFLHWYHHVTVLLYCWHAYSIRIGTGLWFAAMNYSVHSIMYFYFGLTQCGPRGRKLAKRFAMLITSLQLLQMIVGIMVTVASVVYHAQGATCFVSLTNSAMGLVMYASYFALFLQLFLSHYVYAKKPKLPSNCPSADVAALSSAADQTQRGRPVERPKVN
uniref:Elongation of fatty acids protein n=1 Tax=Calcidiscus leptoporus TaxID=127549 RepID=A0A7S0JBN1_9EUKA